MTSYAPTFGFGRTLAGGFLALGLVFFAALNGAQAGDRKSVEGATAFLKDFGDKAVAMLSQDGLSDTDRKAELRRLIKAGFELPVIGRFVLGKHWRKATDEERTEYSALFEDFLTATYARRLSSYSGEVLKVGSAREASAKGLILVESKIERQAGADVKVDWRLRQTQGAWRIVDVVVEGVSMAQAQRSEFDAVIRQGGGQIQALLKRLRSATNT
ncbi:MAG: ABC transporter substrate-binding protein [Kiloniellales bacterium]|nr:ABC transporter substrate-binding protein [Kiloniellales bacterium]